MSAVANKYPRITAKDAPVETATHDPDKQVGWDQGEWLRAEAALCMPSEDDIAVALSTIGPPVGSDG